MPIRFNCNVCQTRIRVPDGSEGKEIKCPRCGERRRVPGAWGRATEMPAVEPGAEPTGDKPSAVPKSASDPPPPPSDVEAKSAPAARKPKPSRAVPTPPPPPLPVAPPPESASEQPTQPDVQPLAEVDDDLTVAPDEQTVDDTAVADEASTAELAEAQAAAPEPQAGDDRGHATTEPDAADQAVAVTPTPQAVPMPSDATTPHRTIALAAGAPAAANGSAPPPPPAPRIESLQRWARALWALSVAAILVAAALVIWLPLNLTNDAPKDRRLVLLCGVGVAALFWIAAELVSAAQWRHQRRRP